MRSVNSISYRTPQFSVLSESQIRDIHLAALEVLRQGSGFTMQGPWICLDKLAPSCQLETW